MNIGVIGLGYVGFPLARLCLEKGYKVIGFDLDHNKKELIEKKIDPVEKKSIPTSFPVFINEFKHLRDCNIIIICVPTPVFKSKLPDLSPVKSATEQVARHLDPRKRPLVIQESTINPGVMEEVVKPIFDKQGLAIGKDYYLAHCPERINPGDSVWNVSNIPRVLGAFTPTGLEKAYSFYSNIISGDIVKMSTIRAAEATKIVENSFRDINIAFVNELAKSFTLMDIDIVEVIKGASSKPFAFLAHYPGCGVGGHCIPVDPYYLIEKAKSIGFDHHFLRVARDINNSMPQFTVELLQDALNEKKTCLNGTTIGLLGLSYKANVGDLRESPALVIKALLEKKGANVITCDPFIDSADYKTIKHIQEETNFFVLATNHDEFKAIKLDKVQVLIDGRNMFSATDIPKNCFYKGIGR